MNGAGVDGIKASSTTNFVVANSTLLNVYNDGMLSTAAVSTSPIPNDTV